MLIYIFAIKVLKIIDDEASYLRSIRFIRAARILRMDIIDEL